MNDRPQRDHSADRGPRKQPPGQNSYDRKRDGAGDERRNPNERQNSGERGNPHERRSSGERRNSDERRNSGEQRRSSGDFRGDRRPRQQGDGERRQWQDRDGRGGQRDDRRPYRSEDGDRRPYRGYRDAQRSQRGDRDDRPRYGSGPRDGGRDGRADRNDGRPYRGDRDDRRPPRDDRDDRRPYRGDRDERRPSRNDGDDRRRYRGNRDDRDERRPYRGDRDDRGERRPYRGNRDDRGDRGSSRGKQDGHGDRRPYRGDRDDRRDDRRGQGDRDDRAPYGRGGTRGGGRSDRGGRDRRFTEAERLQHELRPVRSEHRDPIIPDDVQANDLHPAARNELKTLQPDVQERVAKHLAMVALLIDDDPELAHQHALSASRRAGRIPVTRETLGITAYRLGDFALALREFRTYRRLSGLDTHVGLMVDCERGLGRPERGIETGLAVDPKRLDSEQRVHLAVAMSGARLDLGQTQQALFELEIPELNPKKAFSWSPELFGAYAAVLEDLGRVREAEEWERRADQAAAAIDQHMGALDELEVFEVYESREPFEDRSESPATDDEDPAEPTAAEATTAEIADAESAVDELSAAAEPTAAVREGESQPEPERRLSFEAQVEAEVEELLAGEDTERNAPGAVEGAFDAEALEDAPDADAGAGVGAGPDAEIDAGEDQPEDAR